MICMYIRGAGLLPLEFPSLGNGSRRHGDGRRHQEQLTGAECCLTQQQAALTLQR